MTQKILILQGLPGSGKSTFAKELMEKEPGKWKRVNKDLFRIMLDNGIWNDKNEKFILKIRDGIVFEALLERKNVILDDCNFASKHIEAMKNIANKMSRLKSDGENVPDIEIEMKFIDTPLHECIERDSKRETPVGKKAICRMYQQFLNKNKNIVQDIKAPHCYIFDIDGTISTNNGERGFYDWDKVYLDKLNIPVYNVLSALYNQSIIIIVSGRDGSCYNLTKEWLKENKVPFHKMIMRKEGDNRPDEIIKKEIFDDYIAEKYYVEGVFDDRPKVCRMWRDLGLNVFQVGNPDFEF